MTKFIGEDGFYPKWAQTQGRWVCQKVCVQTGKWPIIFPSEASQYLVWVPPQKGFLGSRKISLEEEISSSIRELNYIPFVCPSCGWQGLGKELGYAGERSYYALKCPECSENSYPDLRGLDENVIVKRWIELGKPTLEPPGAAPNIVSIKPIYDLKSWVKSFEPMANELAYVGQQLWPNFATFIEAAQRLDLYEKRNREKFKQSVKGTVFWGVEDNKIYAVDANNGKLRWNYKAKDSIVSSPVVSDNTMYFGAHDKNFYALDAISGELKWVYGTQGEINSTPIVIGNIVCFGSWDGSFFALDTVSGELKWRYKTGGRVLCSPKASNSIVYFGSEDGKWYAVDLDGGNIRWSYSRKLINKDDVELGYNCVGVGNGSVYFVSSDEKLYAIDAETGEEKWIYYDKEIYEDDCLGGVNHAFLTKDGMILCSGVYTALRMLDGASGEEIYCRRELVEDIGPTLNGPAIVANDIIYTFADEGLVAIDLETGAITWRYKDEKIISSIFEPSVVDRIICFVSEQKVIALDALTGDYRWSYKSVKEISTNPTIWLKKLVQSE